MKASTTLVTFVAAVPACQSSFTGLLNSPEAACLNPSALLSFFVGTNQSVPNTVNSWVSGMCSIGSCSNDTLASIVSNITTGCASDFGDSDGSSSVPATVTQILQEAYPTVRSVLCLKDDSTNQLCVTETLNNLETVIGKLSFSDLSLSVLTGDFQKLVTGAANLACTDCTKAAFTLISPLTQQFPEAASAVDTLCGAGFIDGSTPSTVSQTATNEVFSTKQNSAASLSTSKMAGAVLLLVFSAFTLLG
ncbi:hypothetical protein FB45DRAFT_892754 [Roridomyces roridus]|uniref:DUF7729 domain-containing protein n=1 Tax=Roridomyces roridus TaxID=1738132 RepID=A0AAD7FWQ3_9AGAR|nr:hypothetical protein FB45DRAFT_892754 [Roridomyces roridus]